MEINQLEAFLAVAKSNSFSNASQAIHLSQPAISRRISLLEHSLGTPLFERLSTGIALTESGKVFLPYAKQVMAAIQDGLEAIKSEEEINSGIVDIALVGTLASTDFTTKLRKFKESFPKVRIQLRTALSSEVSELVAEGSAYLGLRYFPDPSHEIISIKLASEPMVVAASPDNSVTNKTIIDLHELLGLNWLSFPEPQKTTQCSFYQLTKNIISSTGIESPEIISIDSLSAQKRLIEANFGIGLLPLSSIEEELRLSSLKIVEHSLLKTTIDIYLIHRKSAYLNKAVLNFIDNMK